MNPSTHKKVLVRHPASGGGGNDTTAGYLEPSKLNRDEGLTLMTPGGQAVTIAREHVQAVFFVPGWEGIEHLSGAACWGRSGTRLPGLWVRVRCRGRFHVEGILASELLDLAAGVWLSPLYAESACQRVFIPAGAAERVEAVEMVKPVRRRQSAAGREARTAQQIGLFDAAGNPASPESKVREERG